MRTKRVGHGPSVLLLPSLGRPASDLAALAVDLAAAGYTAVLADPPGVDGVAVPDPAPATLHDLAALALAALDKRDLPVAVVGHAFGGRIARCLAADHPDQVRSIVVLGGGGRVPGDPEAVAALRACFDPRLGPEEHLGAVGTAFFAPGNDPGVWAGGWWPEAAELQRRAGSATAVEDWWEAGSHRSSSSSGPRTASPRRPTGASSWTSWAAGRPSSRSRELVTLCSPNNRRPFPLR